MKKISLCISVAFVLVGCGGNETREELPPVQTPAPIQASTELSPELTRGAKIYKRCRACHTLDEGGKHKVGPNLWAIYGAKTASKEGYAYSKAMRAADIIWDEETMDAYIQKPAAFMPGNKMSFIGLKKQEDRDAVQAYMKAETTP